MADTFDRDDLAYEEGLSAGSIEEWDSLSHVRLVVALERAFGIRFTTEEIDDGETVGDLIDVILKRGAP